jgi:hypothetical protein
MNASKPHGPTGKTIGCLLALLILASDGSSAANSAGSGPQAITIVQHSGLSGPNTFVATGAVNDLGAVVLDSVLATALPAPVVGTAHYIRTYYGAAGTFTVQMQTLLTPTDVPWLWAETGHWVIIEGTGAYAGLQGAGEESGIRDFLAQTLVAVFDGKVH